MQAHFAASNLKVLPTAIGKTPPSFLYIATSKSIKPRERMEMGGLWVMELGGCLWVIKLGRLCVMELGGVLQMFGLGLSEHAVEDLPPVEQYAPLDMLHTLCTEMLNFLLAISETHPGFTLLISIICLKNGYLNNNKNVLYVTSKMLWLQILQLQFLVLVLLPLKCY